MLNERRSMMKKLLVLTLVFGMAAMASATLDWTVTGSTAVGLPTDVNPGDALTLELIVSADQASAVKIDLITDNGGAGDIVAATSPLDLGIDGMDAKAFDDMMVAYGMPSLGLVTGDWAQVDKFTTSTPVGGAVLTLTYIVDAAAAPGIILITAEGIDVLGGNTYVAELGGFVDVPALELTVIPEPMTLALLGLGGLFLRRRK
jgi:hypothetical protein